MEIQQLKGFLAVAKYKGFSQAADKTFRTQPAISLQIKSLEDELNVKLFDRLSPQRIELTSDGKILYDLVSPLLEDIESLKSRFDEARGSTLNTTLRIATHTSVMVHLLPEVIKKFRKKFPACELSIINRSQQNIISMVVNGEADLGICSLKEIPKNIDYQVFARFDRFLIVNKTHALSKKASITLKDIAQYPLILPPQPSSTRAAIDRVFAQHNLKLAIAMEITGREAIKEYVKMGLGISIINAFYLTPQDNKELFTRNLNRYFGVAERGIVTRKGKYLSLTAREFIGMILNKHSLREHIKA